MKPVTIQVLHVDGKLKLLSYNGDFIADVGNLRWLVECFHDHDKAEFAASNRAFDAAIIGGPHLRYLAGWPDDATFATIVRDLCAAAGIPTHDLPKGLRLRDTATHRFAFNYAPHDVIWQGRTIPAGGVDWQPLG